ncbi:MAG TPA: hypothetical protein PLH63_09770, partial [Candidatus Cloacimonadota bacterium]|nr:hypothetical protein [Candidatus Cloacimonadota bacterium]
IKNNQPYLCALWQEMSLQVKALFADYAKYYKIDTRQKRTQGVSGFSMFIYFIYRISRRHSIMIKNMSIDFILSIFSKFNSLNKLMKESLLYRLTTKLPTRFRHLIQKKNALNDEDENSENETDFAGMTSGKVKDTLHENEIKEVIEAPPRLR